MQGLVRSLRLAATAYDRLVLAISATAAAAACALLAFMFVTVQYEVVMRFVFHRPTHWTHEVSTFGISWVGLLSAAYVLRLSRHLEVDIVTTRIGERARAVIGTGTDLLGTAFCSIAAVLGAEFVEIAMMMGATSASELDTPLWIPYMIIPLGFGLLGLEFLARMLARLGLVSGRRVETATAHL